jgi:hypothetical protein
MKRKGSIGFDAMVRFFMQNYEIPTTRDLEKLNAKLNRLEALLSTASSVTPGRRKGVQKREVSAPAGDAVLEVIKRSKQGLKFADIQAMTGFPDKKIRNIIFRLNKLSKIKRHTRGVYVAL